MDGDFFVKTDLVDKLGSRLYRYFSTVFDENRASDCVQETLVRLWQKLKNGEIDKKKGSVVMYSYGIAKNVKREFFRYKHLSPLDESAKIPLLFPEEEELERLNDSFRLKQLRASIVKLKENEREVLSLVIDNELKLEEIAKLLNMPLGTVKSHIYRAKENLKKMLLQEMA